MVNFRLIKLVESRIHREVYVRFGGEYPKIRHRNMKMDVGCLAYIINTVGNIFSGQVVGDTARTLSDRFGKIVQLRESHSVSNENVTTSTNTQLETLIPASKISNLTQGMFVGSVADNFDERIEQKIFHAEIVIDTEKVKAETAAYVPIPEISFFVGEDGKDHMEEIIKENYYRVKADIAELVLREIARIEADPKLAELLPKKK